MRVFKKNMHITDKELECDNTYQKINDTMEIMDRANNLIKQINACLPFSALNNFRDAVFHFRKMVYLEDEQDVLSESFAVVEHLERVESLLIKELISEFSKRMEEVLEKTNEGELKNALRNYLHNMKKLSLISRLNGMMIIDNPDIINNSEECFEKIENFMAFCEENAIVEFKNNLHN